MRRLLTNQKGFTIVELLVYMGLFSIMIGLLLQIFLTTLESQRESNANSEADENGRFILSRFIYDISRATSVASPSAGTTGSVLVLNIGDNNTYRLDTNNNLQLVNTNGTDVLNGYDTSISNLSFQYIGTSTTSGTIKLTYTVNSKTKRAGIGTDSKIFTTSVGLR